MKTRLIIVFLFIVLLPLGLLTWLGIFVARGESQQLESQVRELLTGQLREVEGRLARFMESRERQLTELTGQAPDDPEALRKRARDIPWIRQIFICDADGSLSYPSPLADLSTREQAFLERTQEVWLRGDLCQTPLTQAATESHTAGDPEPRSPLSMAQRLSVPKQVESPTTGWYAWYWGRGLNLIFWNRHNDGRCVGVELDRIRWLADMIGQLPGTDPQQAGQVEGLIQLHDSNNALIYQWGTYEPPANARPAATLSVSPPLDSWRLDYHVHEALLAHGRRGMLLNWLAGLAAFGLTLVGFSLYFYRESTREIREAAQRVSFVNQVSHELKTPLTNIRLYAELLQEELLEEDAGVTRHVGVIVNECERLSRLIGNVLTFSRSRRGPLSLHPASLRIDELVRGVVERFEPGLTRRGIRINCSVPDAPPVLAAGDVIEQILGNLINNVEKYAAKGEMIEIACHYAAGTTTITVADRGPGIPPAERRKIFKPFYRVNSSLTEGVSGAGIGLSIARELARLHGGDLTLEPVERGACFKVQLNTPATPSEEKPCEY